MSDDKRYNGWSNYETWNVKLWMDNDEGAYRFWQEQTEYWLKRSLTKDKAISALADAVKCEYKENMHSNRKLCTDCLNETLKRRISRREWPSEKGN